MHDLLRCQNGTYLAFDFGVKRIGVAVGEWLMAMAHPLKTIRSERNDERFSAIAALIEEWRPIELIVGLPLALDGTPHAMTARCIRFANQLRGRFGIAVEYADERLSSVEAEERLRESGYNAKGAREHVDSVAAQLILHSYFHSISDPPTDTCHVSSLAP